jgi:hypothetical protein
MNFKDEHNIGHSTLAFNQRIPELTGISNLSSAPLQRFLYNIA